MKAQPFRFIDFFAIDGRDTMAPEHIWMVQLQAQHPAVTIVYKDKPICAFGVVILAGVGAVWMRCCKNPPIFLYRAIYREMCKFLAGVGKGQLRRIEAVVPAHKNMKFMRRLGFHQDGIASRYFPDGDGYRWVMLCQS